ncbi:hypothetical protein HX021_13900 [Sphingobacterium sp. N143]|uniref:hypothetical protein n=1 Tax=Sphingobacterium sp. N143 TaxID=2746727 RepID=UPI002576450E|nr:hypothetical protein [Sphingobacterium sp. N143]MDM1295377.1 hypothetical protein [Sphingobacterium sp. N143]
MKKVFNEKGKLMRFYGFICLVLLTFSLSSCFDFVEQIDLKTNGSGHIAATMNLSKSKTKVASLLKMKSIKGVRIPSQAEMEKEIKAAVQLLKQTKGISNVQYQTDFTNYVVKISCDFSQIESLNAFSDILANRFKTKISNSNRYYYQGNVFERKFVASADWKTKFNQLGSDNTTQFADAFYTQIVRFEKPIAAQGNNKAKVAANKKAVLLKVPFTDLVYGRSSLANKITLIK